MKPKLNFKAFFEDMDLNRDKEMNNAGDASAPQKGDYFQGLDDEMGMDWPEIVSSLEGEPWVSASFKLGGNTYKNSGWEIVKGSLSPNGAQIKLINNVGRRSYTGSHPNKGPADDKTYFLNREQLIAFLTKGWSPALTAQAGMAADSMAGGAPPL